MSLKLRPSKAPVWMQCAGSPAMQQPYLKKVEVNEAAEEGTAAHWVAQEILLNKIVYLGTHAPNGIMVDGHMIWYGKEYRDHLQNGNNELHVEETLVISALENEGTPDLFYIDDVKTIVHIIDYKYGFTPVEVEKNWQLLCYAYGIMEKYSVLDYAFEFTIFQPRALHPDGAWRSIKYAYAELDAILRELEIGAAKALQVDAIITSGSHCKYCEARHVCTAAKYSAGMALQISKIPTSMELSVADAGAEVLLIDEALAILNARRTGLESQIKSELMAGKSSPHFELDKVNSREKWIDGAEDKIIAMGKLLGLDLAAPGKALTPAQCRKLKFDEEIIKANSIKPEGALKLVPLNTNRTKKLFGK